MRKLSIKWKVLIPLFLGFLVMSLAFVYISYIEFRDYTISDCVNYAKGLCSLIADEIDPERVDEYMEQGHAYPGYDEIRAKLYKLRDAYPDIVFLYVYQIREDGCHAVFDLDAEGEPGSEPGEVLPFDQSYEQYIPDLLAGKEVPALISNDTYGYLLTIYTPIRDSSGQCRCYVGVDYSMDLLMDYVMEIVKKILMIFAIVVIVIAIVSVILTNRGIVNPFIKLEKRAYRDTLTGFLNRTAYFEYALKLDERIAAGTAAFSILMIDVNFLKKVNDTYGHEKGNSYLKNAADLICSVFGSEHLYRIGGDEFVAVLEGNARDGAEERMRTFREEVRKKQEDETLQPWERVSAAIGIAVYEKGKDQSADDVLKRADQAMYAAKTAMKAERRE